MSGITFSISVILPDISGITGVGPVGDEVMEPFGWVVDLIGEEEPAGGIIEFIEEGIGLVCTSKLLQPGRHNTRAVIKLVATNVRVVIKQGQVYFFFKFIVHFPEYVKRVWEMLHG